MTPDNEILQAMRGRNSTTPDTEGEFSTADYKGTRYLARGGKIVSCYPIDTPDTEEKSPQQEWIDRAKEDIDTNLKHMNNQPIFNTPDTEKKLSCGQVHPECDVFHPEGHTQHTISATTEGYTVMDTTPDTEVEIEQNAETGEVLTANGVNLTPDTEWRERLWELVEVAPSGAEVLNCYPESVVAIIEQALSSRDTYWKERVREEVEGLKHKLHSMRKDVKINGSHWLKYNFAITEAILEVEKLQTDKTNGL